jgi:hypothetical protein
LFKVDALSSTSGTGVFHRFFSWSDKARARMFFAPLVSVSGCDSVTVLHKPQLLSDNGPCDIAGDLAKYVHKNGIKVPPH